MRGVELWHHWVICWLLPAHLVCLLCVEPNLYLVGSFWSYPVLSQQDRTTLQTHDYSYFLIKSRQQAIFRQMLFRLMNSKFNCLQMVYGLVCSSLSPMKQMLLELTCLLGQPALSQKSVGLSL